MCLKLAYNWCRECNHNKKVAYLEDVQGAVVYRTDKHLIVRYRFNKAENSLLLRGFTLYTVYGDLESVSWARSSSTSALPLIAKCRIVVFPEGDATSKKLVHLLTLLEPAFTVHTSTQCSHLQSFYSRIKKRMIANTRNFLPTIRWLVISKHATAWSGDGKLCLALNSKTTLDWRTRQKRIVISLDSTMASWIRLMKTASRCFVCL